MNNVSRRVAICCRGKDPECLTICPDVAMAVGSLPNFSFVLVSPCNSDDARKAMRERIVRNWEENTSNAGECSRECQVDKLRH